MARREKWACSLCISLGKMYGGITMSDWCTVGAEPSSEMCVACGQIVTKLAGDCSLCSSKRCFRKDNSKGYLIVLSLILHFVE